MTAALSTAVVTRLRLFKPATLATIFAVWPEENTAPVT